MSSDSKQAEDYADVIANEVRELEASLLAAYAYAFDGEGHGATFDGADFDDPQDIIHHYANYCALAVSEVTNTTYYAGGSTRERKSVEVTRTVGGPGAFVDFDGDGYAVVRVYWGSNEASRRVHAPTADTELWELMDALATVAKAY
jgi:hypothetical protein